MSELLTKSRLRVNGEKLESTNDVANYIVTLLKQKPMTTQEITIALGKTSSKSVRRDYLKSLEDSGRIEKISATQSYKVKGSGLDATKLQQELFTDSEYWNCETIKAMIANNSSKEKMSHVNIFVNMCSGKIYGTGYKNKIDLKFKTNPDFWNHPETTKQLTDELKSIFGGIIPRGRRMAIRHFLQDGLGINLSKTEAQMLGIQGDKDESGLARLHMTTEQYDNAKKILKPAKGLYVLWGFRVWSFCRPSTTFTVKIDDLKFYDRTVRYIEVDGEKISHDKTIKYAMMKNPQDVRSYTHRACEIPILEFKTIKKRKLPYIKEIFDEDFVKALEEYAKQRKKDGFKYLFWDDNTTEFTFENYNKITKHKLKLINESLKPILLKLGFKKGDVGKSDRMNYALRHFGAQLWLQATSYNYGLIADMGWEDITTLKKYYGERTGAELQKALSEVVF